MWDSSLTNYMYYEKQTSLKMAFIDFNYQNENSFSNNNMTTNIILDTECTGIQYGVGIQQSCFMSGYGMDRYPIWGWYPTKLFSLCLDTEWTGIQYNGVGIQQSCFISCLHPRYLKEGESRVRVNTHVSRCTPSSNP